MSIEESKLQFSIFLSLIEALYFAIISIRQYYDGIHEHLLLIIGRTVANCPNALTLKSKVTYPNVYGISHIESNFFMVYGNFTFVNDGLTD